MIKVLICVGTRPNLIKITRFEEVFRKYPGFEYILLHTGQHYDHKMNRVFFEELGIKEPDIFLGAASGSQIEVLGDIMVKFDKVLDDLQPDLVLVPGDVNSSMACALVASRKNITVGHIESGLRSFDKTMPEEVNRIIIDDVSDFYFISEPAGLANLKNEGKPLDKLFFVGNTMIDALIQYEDKIEASDILSRLGLDDNFALFTFHRPHNVDNQHNLTLLVELMNLLAENRKVVFPVHPRTRKNMEQFGLQKIISSNILLTEPLGYLDFLKLMKASDFIITDSGGIQEETTFLKKPCITIRPNTERPVTIEQGTNTLSDLNIKEILTLVGDIEAGRYKKGKIPELWDGKTTERIVDILDKTLNRKKETQIHL